MTIINRALWLSAAATAVFAMGCGETSTTDAGTDAGTGAGCTSDTQCSTGKVCHPVLKSCVASCTGSTDCPAAEKTCAKFDGTAATASSPGFCQCSTDALCSNSVAGNICSTATKQCTAKCTSSSCPTGSTCNSTTGQCAGGGTDAGSDAGTDAGTDAGVTCNTNNDQPDVCGYGSACTASMTCEAIVDGTCANVAARPAWTSASTGPVIFNIVDEADVAADCAADNAFTMTVYAYAGSSPATFPAMKSALPGFFYYTSTGTQVDIPTNLLRQSNYTVFAGSKVIGAKFTVCSTATSSIVVGVGFTNGNGYCTTLTR